MLQKLGIKRVRMPLPFRLNHVNCFLAEGDHGYTIIDTGLNNSITREIWKQELGDHPLEQIILTHLHPDHCGLAGRMQRKNDARVSMSETDMHGMAKIWDEESIPKFKRDFEQAGTPDKITNGIQEIRKKMIPAVTPLPDVTDYLVDEQVIAIGTTTFKVITVPGHAAGLVCFYQKEHNLLLSTDHILPKITPNIAYWFYGEQNPLQTYQHSLEKIKKLHAEYIIPSHGDPFRDANKRIDEIWAHHEERLEVTLNGVKGGASIFKVCADLFNRVLSIYEYQFAIGETTAHLEYLRAKGEVARELVDGIWIYTRT